MSSPLFLDHKPVILPVGEIIRVHSMHLFTTMNKGAGSICRLTLIITLSFRW